MASDIFQKKFLTTYYNLIEKFRNEAPLAWELLGEKNRQNLQQREASNGKLGIQHTVKDRDSDGVETRGENRRFLRIGSDHKLLVDTRTLSPSMEKIEVVEGQNPSYRFRLRRRVGDQKWNVLGIDDLTSLTQSVSADQETDSQRLLGYRKQFGRCPVVATEAYWFDLHQFKVLNGKMLE